MRVPQDVRAARLTLRTAIVIALLGATASRLDCQAAASAPLIGEWQLNLGRTHYGPGVDRRRNERMACTAAADAVQCVIQSRRSDGRTLTGEFAASLDGTPAKVTGIPDVDHVLLRQPSRGILDATFLYRGKAVFGYRAFQSDDGRSLLIVSVNQLTRAAATTVVVYDRR